MSLSLRMNHEVTHSHALSFVLRRIAQYDLSQPMSQEKEFRAIGFGNPKMIFSTGTGHASANLNFAFSRVETPVKQNKLARSS